MKFLYVLLFILLFAVSSGSGEAKLTKRYLQTDFSAENQDLEENVSTEKLRKKRTAFYRHYPRPYSGNDRSMIVYIHQGTNYYKMNCRPYCEKVNRGYYRLNCNLMNYYYFRRCCFCRMNFRCGIKHRVFH